MFIQIMQGKVGDPGELKAAADRWAHELAPGSIGWLGTTAGVTGDGTFIALVHFESPEAARQNSDRPEQAQWWAETSKLFSGEVTFHDCTETEVWGGGGSDAAGFVQVIQGRVRDFAGLVDHMRQQDEKAMQAARPDIIGGVSAAHPDGGISDVLYFTTEAEARENERKEPPEQMKAMMEEMMRFYEGDEFTYLDLKTPWLYTR
ncbi:hypothetical protein J4573_01605 [Actinomadura barringtoniae]|uniref:Uncharacterized protein n=1 Tax=Actinomadura barringtoniae TaxID=1427535 RepID=A0A939P5V4_9ACTN|nr:hypothetical protein [Actinomadura barringtoniae]MBO2445775.1 hypothetical protein [Actinomadura barringtoniae]